MTEFASLVATIEAGGAVSARQQMDEFASATGRAESATEALAAEARAAMTGLGGLGAVVDDVAGADVRLAREALEAEAAIKRQGQAALQAAGHFDALYDQYRNAPVHDFVTQYAAGATAIGRVDAAQMKAVGSSKALTQAGLGLSRQFADVGVSLAGGISPMMVLIQQGPQIADVFGQAKQQGLGFGAMMKGLVGTINPVTLGIAAVGAAAVAGFGLFAREVDKSTKYATSWGDTWNATIKVVGKAIMEGPIGDGLKWLGGAFAKALDGVVDGVMWFVDEIVGHFGAAYQLIVKNWQRLPEVFGVIIQGAANITIRGVEGLVNGAIKGINYLLKKAGMETLALVDLPEIKVANAKLAADYDKLATEIKGSFRKGRKDFLDDVANLSDQEYLARQKAKKGAKEHAAARDEAAEAARREADALAQAATDGLNFAAALRTEAAEMGLGTRELKLRNIALQEMVAIANGLPQVAAEIRAAGKEWETAFDAEQAKAGLKDMEAALEAWLDGLDDVPDKVDPAIKAAEKLADAFDGVAYSLDGIFAAFKGGDFSRLGSDILGLAASIKNAFKQGGFAGGLGAVAGAAAPYVGGTAGRALGGLAAGAQIGSIIPGVGTAIGAAVGAIVGGLSGLLKGKPSNAGAGYDLVTGAISGNKRNADTEGAAVQTGLAIKAGQDLLRQYATLNETITGLVIGTRDQTQIYTSQGDTLRTAVGDASAAAEAALQEVLRSATFTNEAQQKLVTDMLAAGKGFDDIAAALGDFRANLEAASGIIPALEDEIARLTAAAGDDAAKQAYETAQVVKAIEEQRKAYSEMVKAGYLTAADFDTIGGHLDTIKQLRIDEILRRFATATEDVAEVVEEVAEQVSLFVDNGYLQNITRTRNVTPTVRDPLAGVNVASLIRGQIETAAVGSWANDNLAVPGAGLTASALMNHPAIKGAQALAAQEWANALAHQKAAEQSAEGLKAVDDAAARLARSFLDLADSLQLGSGTSGLKLGQQYAFADQLYRQTLAAARGGDEDAAGRLGDVTTRFAELSRLTARSEADFRVRMARIQADLRSGGVSGANDNPVARKLDELMAQNQRLLGMVAENTRQTNEGVDRLNREGIVAA